MSMGDATISPATAAPPTEALDDTLHCPLCDYDLRGLMQNRCPECGHAFDPAQLRRTRAQRHPWLFEHGQRHRVLRFIATSFVSLVPFVFWQRVLASHEIVARRLWIWAIAWVVLAFVIAAAIAGTEAVFIHNAANSFLYRSLRPPGFSYAWTQTFGYTFSDRGLQAAGIVAVYAFAWVGVTMLAMTAFGYTLRRAGVYAGHRWRLTLYTLPSLLLPPIALGVAVAGLRVADWWIGPCVLAVVVLSTIHLVVSHVLYMRVRHAFVQAILTQIMTLLALIVLTAVCTGELWE